MVEIIIGEKDIGEGRVPGFGFPEAGNQDMAVIIGDTVTGDSKTQFPVARCQLRVVGYGLQVIGQLEA